MKFKTIAMVSLVTATTGIFSAAHAQTLAADLTYKIETNTNPGEVSDVRLGARRSEIQLAEEHWQDNRKYEVVDHSQSDSINHTFNLNNADVAETVAIRGGHMNATSTLKPNNQDTPSQYLRDIVAYTDVSWRQNFSLEAHSSFSVTGQLNLSGAGKLGNMELDGSWLEYALDGASPNSSARVSFLGMFSNPSLLTGVNFDFSDTGMFTATFRNDSDQLATGFLGGELHAYVPSSPVPEPSVMLSLMLGLGVVGGVARKRKSQQAANAA